MKRRSINNKIQDIKHIRSVAILLGKIGITGPYWSTFDYANIHTIKYGIGLKDAKDVVERMFDYYTPGQETEADLLESQRVLRNTISVYNLAKLLHKLEVSPIRVLGDCRQFAVRVNC